jgi:hypothetical protein
MHKRFNLLDIVEEIDPNHLLAVVEVHELILLLYLIHLMYDQVHCIEGVARQNKTFVFYSKTTSKHLRAREE